MKKLKLLFAICALIVGTVATMAQDAVTYYIQNVSNGKWLGPGNNWGTQASVLNHADYWKVVRISDGVYTLESVVSNGGSNYYLNGTYCDGGATNFTFTAVAGKENTYTIAGPKGGLLTTNGTTVNVDGSDVTATVSQWKLWNGDDMDAGMAAATIDTPFDATYLIKDHDLGRNNRDYSAWINTGATEPKTNDTNAGGNMRFSIEAYKKTFDVYQTLSNVPNGVYAIRVNGFYRQDGSDNRLPYVYANESQTTLPVRTGSENNMQSAAVSFEAGNYLSAPAFVQVTDNTLKVGVATKGTSCWTIFKNFHLTYYGNCTVAEVVLASYVKDYRDALTEAQAFTENSMFASAWQDLQSVLTANTLDLSNVTQEQLETATANLQAAIAAANAAVNAKTVYDNAVSLINGGTNVDLTSLVVNASFEDGNLNGWTSINGGNVANNSNWSKVGTWFVERWTANADTQKHLSDGSLTHDALVLPAGLYTITAKAQNQEQKNGVAGTGYFLYANNEKVEITGTNTYSASVLLSSDKSELVIKFALESCTGNWISCDDVHLTYVGEDFPSYTLVTGKMNADVEAAQTAANEAFIANKTIANYNVLEAAIAAAQASKDAYVAAATAIANAKDIQSNQNFASSTAYSTFAEAIAAIENPYNANTLSTDAANNAGLTLGTVITSWHAGANSAAVKYLNDGFSLNGFDAALYINTWSEEGESDGSNFKVPFYEYFTGEGSSLGANTWTGALTGLENGLYEVSVWVRVKTKNGDTAAADAAGISMNVNGGTAIDVTEGDVVPVSAGNARYQHKVYTAEGLVKDGKLYLNIVIDGENNIHWLSFKNVKYTKVRDLNPDEMIVWADEFAAAQQNAETVLNNEDYQNVTGSERVALNAAKNATPSDDAGYQAAISAIEAAIDVFTAAKGNYDLLAAEIAYANSLGVTTTSFAPTESSTAATVLTNIENLKVAEYTHVTTVYSQNYELNNWTEDFTNDYNNEGYKANGPTYWDVWGNTTCTGKTTVTLPAGDYALSVIARGQVGTSGYLYYKIGENETKADLVMKGSRGLGVDVNGVANFTPATDGNGINYNCNNEGYGWEYRFLTFNLTEETEVTLGVSVSVSNQWASAYNPQLYRTESSAKNTLLNEITEALNNIPSGIMKESVETALNTAVSNASDVDSNNSLEELTNIANALKTAIANANTSIAAYAVAAKAIDDAKELKNNHNFASEDAITTFAQAIAAIENPYTDRTLTDEDANNAGKTLGVVVTGWRAGTNGAAVKYLNDGFSLNDFDQALYVNTWSTEGENDLSGFVVPFYEYYTANSNSLAEKTWTGKLTGLANGQYMVQLLVRARIKDNANDEDNMPSQATGLSIDINGYEGVNFSNNMIVQETRFRMAECLVVGLVKDGVLNLNINVAAENNISWLSFKNVKYTKIRDLEPDEMAVAPADLVLDATKTIFKGKTATLTPTSTTEGASIDGYVTWVSDNTNVATVENGVVTAVAYGTANITATSTLNAEANATCAVTVTAPAITEAENLDFAEGPVATTNVVTYDKDKGTGKAQMQEVTGWSFGVANGDAKAGAVMAYGSSYGLGSTDIHAPATNPASEASGNALGIVAVWLGSVQYIQDVKLPAGAYTITIPIYRNGGNNALAKNLIGVILDDGKEYLASTKTYSANAWTTETIQFVIDEETYGKLSIGYNAQNVGGGSSQRLWIDGMTISFEPFATTDDYAALNQAIQANDNKTLGFLEGEYAPYTNVEILEKLAAAKAIDQTANNAQSAVQSAATALAGASWTANTEEVNAFFDGSFEHDYSALSGNVQPLGWYRVEGTYSGDGYNVRYVSIPEGVEGNTSNHGLFGKFTMMYGKQTGYSLPLKAGVYSLSFMYGGWNEKGSRILKLYNGENEATIVPTTTVTAANNTGHTTASSWGRFDCKITVPADGDYVFSFYRENTSSQNQIVVTDLKMFSVPESSATLAVTAAKYGTFIAPFDVTLPEGVTAYTVTDGEQLTLTEVTNNIIPANTPVVVSSEEVVSETVKGYSIAIKNSYTTNALTGTYVDIDAPDGSYVLQNHDGKVGFYKVDYTSAKPKVRANRAYLSSGSNARSSFLFEDSETVTAINAVKALTEGEALIYDMNGVQQPRLKKGMNIIRTKDGRTQKVMVR